jgi:hypothetical protein
MKKKKRSTRIGVLITILGILLLLGGLLLNGSDMLKDNSVPKQNNTDYNSTNQSAKMISLYSSIVRGDIKGCGTYKLFTDRKMTVKDLSNEDIGKYALYKLYTKDKKKDISEWVGTVYKESDIEDAVKELFGSSIKFTHGDINGNISMKYDKGKYKVSGSLDNSACPKNTKSIIVDSIDKKSEIDISIRIVFYEDGKYYADYAKTNEIVAKTDEKTGKIEVDYDKGTLYNLVFKKDNDNYIFDYVEPVNE